MQLLQAAKLDLRLPGTASSSSSSPILPQRTAASAVFDPHTRTLAVMLSDSSYLIYHPIPSFPCSPSSCLPPPTVVPPISTAACFIRLVSKTRPGAGVLFVSLSPYAAGSSVLLRAWILQFGGVFAPASLSFKRQIGRSAIVMDLRHGVSPRMVGSVNAMVIHSLAENQIWVIAARLVEKDEGVRCEGGVVLSKCAVVDCTLPVYSVQVSMGLLLLGEAGGVRVIPLRPLIKGTGDNGRRRASGAEFAAKSKGGGLDTINPTNGFLRTVKLKQDSSGVGFFYGFIKSGDCHACVKNAVDVASVKAISIHAFAQKNFLIVDSIGCLHLLDLHKVAFEAISRSVPEINGSINHFCHAMKAQMLAAFPDIGAGKLFWISDGGHTLHLVSLSGIETSDNLKNNEEKKENKLQMSVIQAIFTREKMDNVVSIAANVILVVGQGNLFVYAFS